MSDIAVRR